MSSSRVYNVYNTYNITRAHTSSTTQRESTSQKDRLVCVCVCGGKKCPRIRWGFDRCTLVTFGGGCVWSCEGTAGTRPKRRLWRKSNFPGHRWRQRGFYFRRSATIIFIIRLVIILRNARRLLFIINYNIMCDDDGLSAAACPCEPVVGDHPENIASASPIFSYSYVYSTTMV